MSQSSKSMPISSETLQYDVTHFEFEIFSQLTIKFKNVFIYWIKIEKLSLISEWVDTLKDLNLSVRCEVNLGSFWNSVLRHETHPSFFEVLLLFSFPNFAAELVPLDFNIIHINIINVRRAINKLDACRLHNKHHRKYLLF